MKSRFRKDDRVIVITGNDKGVIGSILAVDAKNSRVVVSGVNMRKKHLKKSQEHPKGSIVTIESPIHVSNVKACPKEKGVRLFVRINANQEKEYCYHQDDEVCVYRGVKSKA